MSIDKKRIKRWKWGTTLLEELMKKQDNKCNMCSTPLEKGRYHIDHINSIHNGGVDLPKNMQILCVRCHKKKTFGEQGKTAKDENTYVEVCKYCGKVIESFTKKQVEMQMSVHLVTQHKDKVEIKEVKKK